MCISKLKRSIKIIKYQVNNYLKPAFNSDQKNENDKKYSQEMTGALLAVAAVGVKEMGMK